MHLKIQSSSAYVSTRANKSFLFRSQSGKRPAPTCKGALRVLYNFHLNHKVLLKTPFCVWTLYFFALQTVFFLFFQPHCLACDILSNRGASFVLIIGHCFLRFDVPKLICINLFDQKTLSHSFSIPRIIFKVKSLFTSFFKKRHFVIFLPLLSSTPSENLQSRLHNAVVVDLPHVLSKCQSTLLAPIRIFNNASNERDKIFPTPLRVWYSEFFWLS